MFSFCLSVFSKDIFSYFISYLDFFSLFTPSCPYHMVHHFIINSNLLPFSLLLYPLFICFFILTPFSLLLYPLFICLFILTPFSLSYFTHSTVPHTNGSSLVSVGTVIRKIFKKRREYHICK